MVSRSQDRLKQDTQQRSKRAAPVQWPDGTATGVTCGKGSERLGFKAITSVPKDGRNADLSVFSTAPLLALGGMLGEDESFFPVSLPGKTKSASEKKLSPSAAKLRLLKRLRCTLKFEKKAWGTGARLIAGVDEVGRGSLFGAVVAAAVILDPGYRIRGLRDSKLLKAERREVLAERIREHAIAYSIAAVDSAKIDQINIYHASRLAMKEAVLGLQCAPDFLLIDALRIDVAVAQQPIIHGDALSASIAAASILAKVERDKMVSEWDPVFPNYHLASNKGYSTPRHIAALREFGPSPLHRQSFAPVWNAPVPPEVLGFMLEEAAKEEALDEEPTLEELVG
jgi:ribonuclease HII